MDTSSKYIDMAFDDAMKRKHKNGKHVANPFDVLGTQVGRNEPCPCGSGKKYKKCCGSALNGCPDFKVSLDSQLCVNDTCNFYSKCDKSEGIEDEKEYDTYDG